MALDLRLEAQGNHYPALDGRSEASAAAELHWYAQSRERDGSVRTLDVRLFGRQAGGEEEARTHADVRELQYAHAQGAWEWRFGLGRVFWGVTESAHLVDIVNQDDGLEDIDGEDKLGQPLFGLSRRLGSGRAAVYLLPRFRERAFGPLIRSLSPLPVATEEARFESAQGRQHVDWALRLTQRWGGLDVGLSAFHGTAREPRLLPCAGQGTGRPGTETQANCNLEEAFAPPELSPVEELLLDVADLLGVGPDREAEEQAFIDEAMADAVLVPHYDQIEQLGLDLQWVQGAAAWKLEARAREQQGEWQYAAAAGVEYSLGVFWEGMIDLGLLLEYLYDDRPTGTSLNLFDDDLFVGMRLLGNDVAGTQALGGVVIDREDGGLFWSLELSRRLGGSARVALEGRAFQAGEDAGALERALDGVDSLRLQLEYYF